MITEFMNDLPVSDAVIIACELSVIMVMIALLVFRSKRHKRQQFIDSVYSKKRRDENLLRKISNEDKDDASRNIQPYEVLYNNSNSTHDAEEAKDISHNLIRLQLVVTSEMSTKKYIFDLGQEFTIGRKESNDLVLEDERISSVHCVLINRMDNVYAADLKSTNGTELQRHHERIRLTKNPIKILDGDKLILAQKITVEIRMI